MRKTPGGEFCAPSKNKPNSDRRCRHTTTMPPLTQANPKSATRNPKSTNSSIRSNRKRDPECLMPVRQLISVDRPQLALQSRGTWKTVRNRISIRKLVDLHRINRDDVDMTDPRNVASLPRAHMPELPQTDRLRLFTRTNGRKKLLLEQQHLSPGKRRRAYVNTVRLQRTCFRRLLYEIPCLSCPCKRVWQ